MRTRSQEPRDEDNLLKKGLLEAGVQRRKIEELEEQLKRRKKDIMAAVAVVSLVFGALLVAWSHGSVGTGSCSRSSATELSPRLQQAIDDAMSLPQDSHDALAEHLSSWTDAMRGARGSLYDASEEARKKAAEMTGQVTKTADETSEAAANRFEEWKDSVTKSGRCWRQTLRDMLTGSKEATKQGAENTLDKFEAWKRAVTDSGQDWKKSLFDKLTDAKEAGNEALASGAEALQPEPKTWSAQAEQDFDAWKRSAESKGEDFKQSVFNALTEAKHSTMSSKDDAQAALTRWKKSMEAAGEDWKQALFDRIEQASGRGPKTWTGQAKQAFQRWSDSVAKSGRNFKDATFEALSGTVESASHVTSSAMGTTRDASSEYLNEWKQAMARSGRDWRDALLDAIEDSRDNTSRSFSRAQRDAAHKARRWSQDAEDSFAAWRDAVYGTGIDFRDSVYQVLGGKRYTAGPTEKIANAFDQWKTDIRRQGRDWKEALEDWVFETRDVGATAAQIGAKKARRASRDWGKAAQDKFSDWHDAVVGSGRDFGSSVSDALDSVTPEHASPDALLSKFAEWKEAMAQSGHDWRVALEEFLSDSGDKIKELTPGTTN